MEDNCECTQYTNNWLVCYKMLHRALDLVVSCKYSNKPSESEDAKFLDKLSTVELFKKDAAPAVSFITIK